MLSVRTAPVFQNVWIDVIKSWHLSIPSEKESGRQDTTYV